MGWEKIPNGFIEIRPGVYERIDEYKRKQVKQEAVFFNKNTSSDSKPKRPVRNDSLAKNSGEKKNAERIHVRVTFFRKRLVDPDNNTPKYAIDCLRYAKILSDDSEHHISLETRQEKTKEQEETLIELFRI
jgi:hypothetical protein